MVWRIGCLPRVGTLAERCNDCFCGPSRANRTRSYRASTRIRWETSNIAISVLVVAKGSYNAAIKVLKHYIGGGPLAVGRSGGHGGWLGWGGAGHSDHRGSWSRWNIRLFVLFDVRVVGIRSKIHEVGNVEVVLVIFRIDIFILVVHDIALGSNAHEGVERLRGSNTLASENKVIAGSGSENTRKHDVGAQSIAEDVVADFTIRSIELGQRCARTVVGGARRAAVRAVQWDPRDDLSSRAIEAECLGGPVCDCNGLVTVIVYEDATCRRNLAASGSRIPLERLRRGRPGPWC